MRQIPNAWTIWMSTPTFCFALVGKKSWPCWRKLALPRTLIEWNPVSSLQTIIQPSVCSYRLEFNHAIDDQEKAICHLEHAIKIDPTYHNAWTLIGHEFVCLYPLIIFTPFRLN